MDFIKKLLNQAREAFNKLSTVKKVIVGAVAGVIIISFVVLFSVSSQPPTVMLFSELSATDFGQVTKKLDEMGYKYTTTGTTAVFVDSKERDIIMTRLAQENMIPKGIPGWKLFDMTKWTETDKELDVKYMRALRDEIKRHIESLAPIDKADVEIAMSEENLYDTTNADYTAAVSVYLKPGYDRLSKKEIKGIVYLVSRAVGTKLKPENVTVTDQDGKIISDFDDTLDKGKEEISILEERRKLKEKARMQMLKSIRDGLERIYSADRIQIVNLNLEYNWDQISEEAEIYSPIIMQKADPNKPYLQEKVQDSLVVSEKNTDEKFQGHGWNPEGPAGTESNRPPGYKASDDQFANYQKNEQIKNHAVNKTMRKTQKEPYEISKVSVSIAIDGIQDLPRLTDGNYDLDPASKPVQIALTQEQLKQAENIVKKAVGFDQIRGDQVAVENIMFDRSKEWDSIRGEYLRKEQMKKMLLAALIGIFALFLGFILYSAIKKELARRRRIREERLALEQQRMREAAMRAAEEEGVDVELSLEEKARLELQQNAINLAKEKPDDVAKLLRTWLAEE